MIDLKIEKYECPKCGNNMFESSIDVGVWKCCRCKYEYDTAKIVYELNKKK